MNMQEKSANGNGSNKKVGALALVFGAGVLTGAGVSELLQITKDYCCVGQSLTNCKCRYECRTGETDRGDC